MAVRRVLGARLCTFSRLASTKSLNPANDQVVGTHEFLTDDQLQSTIETAHASFQSWKKTHVSVRSELLLSLAYSLRNKKDFHANLITREMGKPISQAKAEIEKCAGALEFYAENAPRMLAEEHISIGARDSFVTFQPLGVVAIVMPWNFPYWQVIRQAAPCLAAGNTMLLKHAHSVFGCAAGIQAAFIEAGIPPGVFTHLPIDHPQLSAVIEHPFVRAASFTGSTAVGRKVAEACGKEMKRCVLELGGSDPYIILEDADLDQAAAASANGKVLNCGQSCIGAKRFIVVDKVYDDFLARFTALMKAVKVGDPTKEDTEMGPLVSKQARVTVHDQVTQTTAKGGVLALGGRMPDPSEPGAYYPPTILTNIKPGMPAYHQEIFGPVATVIRAQNETDAIRIANDSPFGLGGAVFTRDVQNGQRIATEEIDAGMCFVNDFVKSDIRLPFGGTKLSGLGRECSHYGIKEFVNIKTVVVRD